jgi:hypothetical protein
VLNAGGYVAQPEVFVKDRATQYRAMYLLRVATPDLGALRTVSHHPQGSEGRSFFVFGPVDWLGAHGTFMADYCG